MTTQRQQRRRKAGRQARRTVPSPVRSCWDFWLPNPDFPVGLAGWTTVPLLADGPVEMPTTHVQGNIPLTMVDLTGRLERVWCRLPESPEPGVDPGIPVSG